MDVAYRVGLTFIFPSLQIGSSPAEIAWAEYSMTMSTQDSQSILFTHAEPQQGFRLLELPPDLEKLLCSEDAPVLELKSPSAALAHAVIDPSAREFVNICTPTQTFRVRQVQSSNSLHLLRPSLGQIARADIKVVEDEAGESGALNLPNDSVTAIAKCSSTLELHTPPEGFSAIPFLEKSLRLYDRRSDDDDHGDIEMGDESSSAAGPLGHAEMKRLRDEVCADIPVSAAQFELGWTVLCAFVDGKHEPACWRPSARTRLNVWKRIMEGVVLQSIDLEKQFLLWDLWKSVLDDDDEDAAEPPFPRTLLEAVVRRLCAPDQRPPLADDIKWAALDKAECIRWVGETYLAAMAPTASLAIARSEFIRAWKDLLPESWRTEAMLSNLPEGTYKSTDPTTICFVEASQRQPASNAASAGSTTAANIKTTRNWHKLFKTPDRR